MKRVLIIDSHPLMREALRLVLRSLWPTVSIQEAGDLLQAEKIVKDNSAIQLVVIDPALPDSNGLSGLVLLSSLLPRTPIVVFATSRDAQAVASSRFLGAAAYVPKSALMSEVATALRKAAAGETVSMVSDAMLSLAQEARTAQKRMESLSPAQTRVLLNIAKGRLNKQVAADMDVTEATIKAHMTAIFRKLKVANRSQAIVALQPFLRGPSVAA